MTKKTTEADTYPEKYNNKKLWDFYTKTKTPFHIGQSYEKTAAEQIQCAICGSTNFHVAEGHYYTAIRCTLCMWETMIADG